VRTINDQQSVIGAYSFLLGAFPDSINGLTLESDIDAVAEVPVKNFDVNQVRGNLRLGSATGATEQARLYPGNPDALFLTQLTQTYGGVSQQLDQQLYDAKVEYEETHGTRFYEDLANAIHRPVDNIDFYTIFRYADDILTTKANGEASAVNLSKELMDQLSVYYGHYFGNGLFRDEALTRVFAHPYLSSVAHELQIKMEDDQTGKWSNTGIHEAKASLYLANHLTMLAALHLFNEVEDYHVDFNDELRFQLYKDGDRYYVRSLLNDKPLRLEGTANSNGEAEWTAWRDYICSKLYYGNVERVRNGKENPSEHVRLRDSCTNFISNAFYTNDKVLLREHDRAPVLPDEPTPVPKIEPEPRAKTAPSILIPNIDDGVRSQSVDINAGRTSQVVTYGWYKPIKLRQTQWAEFDIPMRKGFAFENLSKKDVSLNQYRKIKIEKTNNTPINLAERHDFNFHHDLLKTREIFFNNVDLVRIPQMSEQNVYLADRHQFNWGENPSLTTKQLKFNYHFKIKIPQTTTTAFAIPEKHIFNYNSNSLDVRKVNFDHIKSVRLPQAESYDVNLADFRFESLKQDKPKSATHATAIDTQFNNNPIPKIAETKPSTGSKVSLGGNVKTTPDYVAPIRIKQQYNSYGVHTTADRTNTYGGSLTVAPEPAPVVPEYVPPTTATPDRGTSYPKYEASTSQYPSYQPRQSGSTTTSTSTTAQPAASTTAQPAASTTTSTSTGTRTTAPTGTRTTATTGTTSTATYGGAYPRYSSSTGTNRVYGSPYRRY
jgi:hypothetical protein